MFKIVILTLVLLVFAPENSSRRLILQPTIINGDNVNITEVPYQLMLTYNKQFQCGAVLISSKHVLTAAHCLYQNGFRSKSKINIFAGVTKKSQRYEEGHMYGVKTYIINALFILTQYKGDIAVIYPDKKIIIDNYTVKPIALAKQSYRSGYEALASGWGLVDDQGTLPDNLQAAYIKTTPCIVFRDSICSEGYLNGICKGDSGGPLVYNNKLIGIARAKISIDGKCALQSELYSSVYYYRDFIKRYTRL
ncbi:hypothetical protein ILUMI_11310 [Ignelater luminosus]|uniref:Peptidase S1 domain-containing protein n=1 Tax=Ignelater luminosus TaxID=2038154 RepID=A0A8K0CW68_IGNLU|nr:hypothetical protein ILUMI_11310 [Ignelater luminosus]